MAARRLSEIQIQIQRGFEPYRFLGLLLRAGCTATPLINLYGADLYVTHVAHVSTRLIDRARSLTRLRPVALTLIYQLRSMRSGFPFAPDQDF